MATLNEGVTVHICSVGKAVIPNLVPILDSKLSVNKVVLVHTAEFLSRAKDLAKVYKQFHIKAELYPIRSAFDMNYLREDLERLLASFEDEKPVINVSGGTKLLSLILFDLATTLELSVYYMNPDNTISWLLPRSSSPVRLQNRAKIRHFLMARGVRIEGNEVPHSDQKIRELLDKVVQHVEQYKKAIRSLNYYAYTAYASLKSKPLKESGDDFWALIDLFKGSGLLRVEDDCLVFRDEKARFFANGGWLEEFLFYQIKQLFGSMPELQDNLCGVKLLDESRGVKNEIDNLFLYQNKLHLIECKTKRFKKDGQPDGGVVQAIYKLDSLMDAFGGLLSRGMVVSVFDFTEADKERAKSYGIKTVTLLELKDMQHHLKNWMLQG